MTYEEAGRILGPERCAALEERLGPPKPLTQAQITLLAGILADPADEPAETDAA